MRQATSHPTKKEIEKPKSKMLFDQNLNCSIYSCGAAHCEMYFGKREYALIDAAATAAAASPIVDSCLLIRRPYIIGMISRSDRQNKCNECAEFNSVPNTLNRILSNQLTSIIQDDFLCVSFDFFRFISLAARVR